MPSLLNMFGSWSVVVIVAAFIFYMTRKNGWRWSQVAAGAILMATIYGQMPSVPASINSGLTGVVDSFNK